MKEFTTYRLFEGNKNKVWKIVVSHKDEALGTELKYHTQEKFPDMTIYSTYSNKAIEELKKFLPEHQSMYLEQNLVAEKYEQIKDLFKLLIPILTPDKYNISDVIRHIERHLFTVNIPENKYDEILKIKDDLLSSMQTLSKLRDILTAKE